MPVASPELIGADTSFLVAHTVIEHPAHRSAIRYCEELGERLFAICPTVLDEFIHVITDPRRFENPLGMAESLEVAETWLTSQETVCLFPCEQSARLHLRWLKEHRLGRKRINDTRIASIYFQNGVQRLLTTDSRDYQVYECFDILNLLES